MKFVREWIAYTILATIICGPVGLVFALIAYPAADLFGSWLGKAIQEARRDAHKSNR